MRMKAPSYLTTEEADDKFGYGASLLNLVKKVSSRALELSSQLNIQADKE
jgi:hypothetical protein